ncbi:uncharacterized protein K460DRAFT_359078 [Cucurbitaria berberidis CBS 394.84]|uniref:Uncharacterized protein n=1 Tax=Cucurbitaria berberidis CBS 394.84 TaxID=1168544 RepID=A0A9P4GBE2_9PLEO|nr:uncharacterized protein K460DRAFT_359078 [Cucurbitaria berberidis CBS 394.84]KAF1842475.1 hypothetical protein K460DRAFT_359078 [Cucurbitaria berberidis CBS 394.84]
MATRRRARFKAVSWLLQVASFDSGADRSRWIQVGPPYRECNLTSCLTLGRNRDAASLRAKTDYDRLNRPRIFCCRGTAHGGSDCGDQEEERWERVITKTDERQSKAIKDAPASSVYGGCPAAMCAGASQPNPEQKSAYLQMFKRAGNWRR